MATFRAYVFLSQDYESPEAGGAFDSSFDDSKTVARAEGAIENKAAP